MYSIKIGTSVQLKSFKSEISLRYQKYYGKDKRKSFNLRGNLKNLPSKMGKLSADFVQIMTSKRFLN